jgi:pimeloyl-ACP methyl ester carboxylesterase
VEKIISWSFSPETDRKIVELARDRLEEVRPGVLHGDFLACDRFDLRKEVGEIEVPAVVLCGEDDQMTPPRYSETLARRIPEARLEIIPGAGHMVMIEQPGRTAELISSFAAGLEN